MHTCMYAHMHFMYIYVYSRPVNKIKFVGVQSSPPDIPRKHTQTHTDTQTHMHSNTHAYAHTDRSFPVSFFELIAAAECAKDGKCANE